MKVVDSTAFLLLLTASSCLHTGQAVECEHVGSMRLESIHGGIVTVPLRGLIPGRGRHEGAAEPCPDEFWRITTTPRTYYGGSGAPIFVNGVLIGAQASTMEYTGETLPFGYQPIGAMRKWLGVARTVVIGNEQFPEIGRRAPRLTGGSLVRISTIWGDIQNGPVGTVTEVRDGWITMFGHSAYFGQHGSRYSVVQKVSPLGFNTEGDTTTVIASVGEPAGCAVYEGPFGPIGRVGRYPPHIRIDFEVVGSSGTVLERTVFVALNDQITAEMRAIAEALTPVSELASSAVLSQLSEPGKPYSWLTESLVGGDWLELGRGEGLKAVLGLIETSALPGRYYQVCLRLHVE